MPGTHTGVPQPKTRKTHTHSSKIKKKNRRCVIFKSVGRGWWRGPILKHKHHQLQNLEQQQQQQSPPNAQRQQHTDKMQEKQQANKGATNTKPSAKWRKSWWKWTQYGHITTGDIVEKDKHQQPFRDEQQKQQVLMISNNNSGHPLMSTFRLWNSSRLNYTHYEIFRNNKKVIHFFF